MCRDTGVTNADHPGCTQLPSQSLASLLSHGDPEKIDLLEIYLPCQGIFLTGSPYVIVIFIKY